MKFILEVDADNAAFEDPGELARVLRTVADKLDPVSPEHVHAFGVAVRIEDVNGNTVGTWSFEPE